MTRRIALAAFATLMAVSCAQPGNRLPAPSGAQLAALTDLKVSGPLDSMNEPERLALEAAAHRVVITGQAMIPAVMRDIEANSDPLRRAVLTRLVAATVADMPAGAEGRRAYDRGILRGADKLMSSSSAAGRRTGAELSALPAKSMLIDRCVRLLQDEDPENRTFAIATLSRVTGFDLGFNPQADAEARKAAAKRWRTWWSNNKDKGLYYSHTPQGNPVVEALAEESAEIARSAGPYPLAVTAKSDGKPVAGAVVAYSYYFESSDGRSSAKEEHATTDESGKMLMARHTASMGMRFRGAELIVSKAGHRQANVRIFPHLLTPNSFTVAIELEETK